jgi:hypothetical protein
MRFIGGNDLSTRILSPNTPSQKTRDRGRRESGNGTGPWRRPDVSRFGYKPSALGRGETRTGWAIEPTRLPVARP